MAPTGSRVGKDWKDIILPFSDGFHAGIAQKEAAAASTCAREASSEQEPRRAEPKAKERWQN